MNANESNQPTSDRRTREFVRLLGEHDGRLNAFILSLVPHWADAHEIAQDVRLRLWEQFDEYDPQGDFGAWARTIAHYKVLAFRKTSARRHAQLSAEFLEAVRETADREAELSEARHEALIQCLQSLGEAQRQLLMRYYASTQTFKQLADETGRSFDAVRQRVLRVRKALAECVTRRMSSEGRS